MNNTTKIEISWVSIIRLFAVALGLLFLYLIRDILALFFVVIIIVAALYPITDRWEKYIPRLLAVILLYVIILSVIFLFSFLIFPPLISQIYNLFTNLPAFLERIIPSLGNWKAFIDFSQENIGPISSTISKLSTNILSTTLGFVNAVIAIVTIVVLTFYVLLEKNVGRDFIVALIPEEKREEILSIFKKIAFKIGSWVRAQLLVMLIIGAIDLVGLSILKVPYALALAFWAGLTEIIPYVGPWLGLIPAAIIGFTISPLTGILVIVWMLGVQQLEGNLLVPKIMQKAVGISPVFIILALLIGAKLFGILGVLLAIPVAASIYVIILEWPNLKRLK